MLQQAQRRIDERAAKTVARHQRPARESARKQRLADHRARQFRRRLARLDVQHRVKQRPQQAVPQRPVATHGLRDAAPGFGEQQRRERQIVARPGVRHARVRVENPPRQVARRKAHGPARPRRQIHERIFGLSRADQFVGGADRARVVQRRDIARHHHVVAAVERRAQLGVVVRTATAARLGSRFMQHDLRAAPLQLHRGGQAGEARADHMYELLHQLRRARNARRSTACAVSAC